MSERIAIFAVYHVTDVYSIKAMARQAVVPYGHNSGGAMCDLLYSFVCPDASSHVGNS